MVAAVTAPSQGECDQPFNDAHRLAEILTRLGALEAWQQRSEERILELQKCLGGLQLAKESAVAVDTAEDAQGEGVAAQEGSSRPEEDEGRADNLQEELRPKGAVAAVTKAKAKRRPVALRLNSNVESPLPKPTAETPHEPTTASTVQPEDISTLSSSASSPDRALRIAMEDAESQSRGSFGETNVRTTPRSAHRSSPKVSPRRGPLLVSVSEGSALEAAVEEDRAAAAEEDRAAPCDGEVSASSVSSPRPRSSPMSVGRKVSSVDIPVFTPEEPPVEWRSWKETICQAPPQKGTQEAGSEGGEVSKADLASPQEGAPAAGASASQAPTMPAPSMPSPAPTPPAPTGVAEGMELRSTAPQNCGAACGTTSPGYDAAMRAPACYPRTSPGPVQTAARGNLLSTMPPPGQTPSPCVHAARSLATPAATRSVGQQQVVAWYQVVFISGIEIRTQANVNGPRTGGLARCGEVVGVSEIVPGSDQRFYLKLADGRGWIFDDSQILPEDPSVVRLPAAPAPCQWPPASWTTTAPAAAQAAATPSVPPRQSPVSSAQGAPPPVLSLAQALAVQP